MNKLLMGIDIGTTSTKLLVTDENGKVLSETNAKYGLLLPNVGYVEQSALDLLEGVLSAIKKATEILKDKAKDVVAISLSTQRDTMVVVDKDNIPLRNAITWMDTRSLKECEDLKNTLGEDVVYKKTGVNISTIWTGAFILWMKNNEKELFNTAHTFGLVHDYIMCALGADKHYLDTTNACQTMMYDFVNNKWDEDILNYVGISEDRLPLLVEPGTIIGKVNTDLARTLNLNDNVLLVAGGGDQQCAILGAGAINEGDGEVSIGTAANIMAATNSIKFDENKKLICHKSLVSNAYMLEGAMLSTGKLIEWLINLFYADKTDKAYELMNKDINENSKPGADGLIITPHFEGTASPHWNTYARGLALGLTLSTTRGDICRAIFEGVAIEVKKNLNLINDMGLDINRIVVSGGATNSPTWLQIIADVLEVKVEVVENKQCAAIGSIIMAGVGSGMFKDTKQGVNRIVKIANTYIPRKEYSKLYRDLYKLNMDSFSALDEASVFVDNYNIKQDLHK